MRMKCYNIYYIQTIPKCLEGGKKLHQIFLVAHVSVNQTRQKEQSSLLYSGVILSTFGSEKVKTRMRTRSFVRKRVFQNHVWDLEYILNFFSVIYQESRCFFFFIFQFSHLAKNNNERLRQTSKAYIYISTLTIVCVGSMKAISCITNILFI